MGKEANLQEKCPLLDSAHSSQPLPRHVLVVHGGAGTITRETSTPEQQAAYKAALSEALLSGYRVLRAGGDAIDAAVAAVTVLEDNPLFNAGKGAVFNIAGKNELETSVMLSKPPASHPDIPASRRGLGLTSLTKAKNPSHLVRALYLAPSLVPHTFIAGSTVETIGEQLGETLVDPSYFFTEHRWKEHRHGLGLPEEPYPYPPPEQKDDTIPMDRYPTGTVGAVALDVHGCISAVTSTGGMTNKLVGRIGDTPCMGSGYWAEEWDDTSLLSKIWTKVTGRKPGKKGVGISSTGNGDYFIRQGAAITIAHRVRYLQEPLEVAAAKVVGELLDAGGMGGVIALDTDGNVTMPLNCEGMYRGFIKEDGVPKTAIFDDEDAA
ncbi:asparaginase [Agrocybe pediades]|nr:asparaginase [Agrocybe pediades]